MAEVEVQTTIFQNPIKVDESEVAVLRSQGLLVEAPSKPAGPGAGDKPDTKESSK